MLDRKWTFHPWLFGAVAVGFLVGCFAVVETVGHHVHREIAAATSGAFMASCGVLTFARPLARAGSWKALVEKMGRMDAGEDPPTAAFLEEARQTELDGYALQIAGPALVIVGTMLNGISGLFA